MNMSLNNKRAECIFLIFTLCAALFLFLYNLDNQYLWQDEAETALISKTILTHGIPMGHDGKNFFWQQTEEAESLKSNAYLLDPWLPYYLSALFFKVFGVSTFVARLPFALVGIATVFLTYIAAQSFLKDKKTSALASVLLLLSVSFLILSRQCRYYTLIAFLSLFGLHSYLLMLEKSRGASVKLLLWAILLFHCHHLYCAILLLTVFVHTLLFYRNFSLKIIVLSVIVIVVNSPWLALSSSFRYVHMTGLRVFDKAFFWHLKQYLIQVHYYIFPAYLLLIPVAKAALYCLKHKNLRAFALKNISLWKNTFLLPLFILCTITALSITGPDPNFRYLTPIIPVFCIITAAILNSVIKPFFNKAIVIIFIMIAAIFAIDFFYAEIRPQAKGIKYPNFFDYLYEITHDYDGPIEGIVKYLNENGSEDDIVAITYGDLPLKFYTKMRVIGGLTGEDLSPAKHADWVILRKHTVIEENARVGEYLAQNIPRENYEKITIDYPDIAFENRENPAKHHFRTVVDEDRVIIYRRFR